MPISIDALKSAMSAAENSAKALGFTYDVLNDLELDKFGRSFERQFILGTKNRDIIDLYMRHLEEIMLGAMVATDQMKKRFDGERPEAGKFGMVKPRAGFFGIGDDWDSVAAFTVGSPQNWIHSGTTLMAGSTGNAIKIGENALHVILAMGSLHKSPKIESHQFTMDGKPKPIIIVREMQNFSDFSLKELDVPFLWKKNTTVLGKVFIGDQLGAVSSVLDYPFLVGVSFIPEDILRLHDVATLPGTTYNAVLTT
jgi:hypothetical protein